MKKLIILLLILFTPFIAFAEDDPIELAWMGPMIVGSGVAAAGGGPTVVATDSFTALDYTELSAHDADWIDLYAGNDMYTVSNGLYGGSDPDSAYRYNATFAANHYSKMVMVAVGDTDGSGVGPAILMQSGAVSYVCAIYTGATGSHQIEVYEVVAGSSTGKDGAAGALSANDVIELRVVGTTVSLYINDSPAGTPWETSLSGGQAGVAGYYGALGIRGDDWESGDL